MFQYKHTRNKTLYMNFNRLLSLDNSFIGTQLNKKLWCLKILNFYIVLKLNKNS